MAATDIKPFTQDDVDHPERFLDKANPRAKLVSFGNHLLLQVTPTKPRPDGTFTVSASWIYRYSIDGRERRMGLGSNKDGSRLSLDDARAEVRNLQKQVSRKEDPLQQRRREKRERMARQSTTVTFQAAAVEYISAHEHGWSSPHYRRQWKRTLETYVYPKIGQVPVADITPELVLRVLEPHWRTATCNMRKIRARIAKILGYAAAKGYRAKGVNPAAFQRINPEITPHGFRSCFKDFASDRTDAPDEVSEFCLGHIKTGLAAAYRRRTAVEKRRELLKRWADYCAVIEGDSITTFKKRSA